MLLRRGQGDLRFATAAGKSLTTCAFTGRGPTDSFLCLLRKHSGGRTQVTLHASTFSSADRPADQFWDVSRLQPWTAACRLRVRTGRPAPASSTPTPANARTVSTDTTATKVHQSGRGGSGFDALTL